MGETNNELKERCKKILSDCYEKNKKENNKDIERELSQLKT
jgi:hypothetical protein